MRRLLPLALVLLTLIFGLERNAAGEAEIPIVAAVVLLGGGIAVAIGNGIRAGEGRPPKNELWEDAGWAFGIANLIGSGGFAYGLTTRNPPPAALPITIGLGVLGTADLLMTWWAVSQKDDEAWAVVPFLVRDVRGELTVLGGITFGL